MVVLIMLFNSRNFQELPCGGKAKRKETRSPRVTARRMELLQTRCWISGMHSRKAHEGYQLRTSLRE